MISLAAALTVPEALLLLLVASELLCVRKHSLRLKHKQETKQEENSLVRRGKPPGAIVD